MATAQRSIVSFIEATVVGILLVDLGTIISPSIMSLDLLCFTFYILGLLLTYDLAKALRSSGPWFWALMAWLLTPIITGLWLSLKAKKVLRSNGVSVGFLGANGRCIRDLRAKAGPGSRKGWPVAWVVLVLVSAVVIFRWWA